MARTSSHRLVFTRNPHLNLGDMLPSGLQDDRGTCLPSGGRCMVDSIYHNESAMHYAVTVSHYPEPKTTITHSAAFTRALVIARTASLPRFGPVAGSGPFLTK